MFYIFYYFNVTLINRLMISSLFMYENLLLFLAVSFSKNRNIRDDVNVWPVRDRELHNVVSLDFPRKATRL